MRRILVAVDGSEGSDKAILKAKELVDYTNGEVTFLSVVDNTTPSGVYGLMDNEQINVEVDTNEELRQRERAVLDRALEVFGNYEGKVNTRLEYGKPADVIMKLAKEGYDLLVMGNRGLGAFSRTFLGSVSNKVVNHIDISVLLVK